METGTGDNTRVYHSKVDASGRIVLPADIRLRQHITTGDRVVIIEHDDGLQLMTQDQAIRDVQAIFTQLAPPDRLLSEELIQERREEAAFE